MKVVLFFVIVVVFVRIQNWINFIYTVCQSKKIVALENLKIILEYVNKFIFN